MLPSVFACPEVYVHPADDCAGLPRSMLQCPDPTNWQPQISPSIDAFAPWGLGDDLEEGIDHEEENDRDTYYSPTFNRWASAQLLYGFGSSSGSDRPEIQFINMLIKAKKRRMKATTSRADELANQDMLLFLEMPLIDAYGKVTREFIVSAGMTLRALQDKVLQPLLGYHRNYHAYLYIDGSDASVYGPSDSQALDMTHLGTRKVWKMIDDKRLRISDVLQTEGSHMEYVYDLGDWWRHTIKVSKIFPIAESSGKVRIVGGSGFAIPENGNGNLKYNEFLSNFRKASMRDAKKELLHDIYSNADNWQLMFCPCCDDRCDLDFRPAEFDIDKAEERIREALKSRLSTQSGTYHTGKMMNGEIHLTRVTRDPTEPDCIRKGGICANCGSPHNLKRCSRCKNVLYCSQECQLEAWHDGHKLECKPFRASNS